MPFPTNPALEAAVVADAGNDLPRLVYADWLDEHGDPDRAAFIRVQCALWDKNPADPDYPDLVEAHRDAFDRMSHRSADLEPKLPDGVEFTHVGLDDGDDGFGCGYHRGFPYVAGEPFDLTDDDVDDVGDAAGRFRAALPSLLATTTVRGLQFGQFLSGQLAQILSAKESGRFTGLSVVNLPHRRATGVVDAIARSPIRTSVQWLDLDLNGDADATALAAIKLPRLRRWTAFHGFRCTPAAFTRVLSAGWFAGLHRICCPFEHRLRKHLWGALAGLPDLHTVEVWHGADDGPLAPLKSLNGFPALGRLRLHSVALSGQNRTALERARFPNLAVFEVAGGMGNDDLAAVAATDWFARLRVLALASHRLTDGGLPALGRSAVAENLRSLTLGCQNLGPKSLQSLALDYPSLTTLGLTDAGSTRKKVTAKEMTRFVAALALPRLRHLNLDWWPLGDSGAAALAKNPGAASLTRLNLRDTGIGAKGVTALLASPHLGRLAYLNLGGCKGGTAVEALADPDVLPDLAYCELPDKVPAKLREKLLKARGDIFTGGW